MIELIVLNYLKSNGINAYMEHNEIQGNEFVVIEKNSDYTTNGLSYARISIDIYAETLYKTSLLAEEIKELMMSINELDSISRVDLETIRNDTDTIMKKYRYYAEFDLVYYD